VANEQDRRSILRSKCELGLVFAREELKKDFPGTHELLQTIVERLHRIETGDWSDEEQPTRPEGRRPTPSYGTPATEAFKNAVGKLPPEKT